MGLYGWACFVGLFCGSVFPVVVVCFPRLENNCKVTKNKRTQQQKNIFAELFFCRIVI